MKKCILNIALLINLTLFCYQQTQAQCDETPLTLEEPIDITLCSNDVLQLNYNAEDNTSTLPNYVYVVEGPNSLIIFEEGKPSLNIIPAQFGAIEGDSICVSGVAFNIDQINGIISLLSNSLICGIAGLNPEACQVIAALAEQGELSSLNDAIDFVTPLGVILPKTIEEIIASYTAIQSQVATFGIDFCIAVSNNGIGKDYCYVVENCCSAPQTINLNSVIDTASNYIAKEVICLDPGFYTILDFDAEIEDCP